MAQTPLIPIQPLAETYEALDAVGKTKEQWVLVEAVARAATMTMRLVGPGEILDAVDILKYRLEQELERSSDLVFLRQSIEAAPPENQEQKRKECLEALMSLYHHIRGLVQLKEISQDQAFAEERAAGSLSPLSPRSSPDKSAPSSPIKPNESFRHAECKSCEAHLCIDEKMIPNYRLGLWSSRYDNGPIIMRLSEIANCGSHSEEGVVNPQHLDFEILDNEMERQWGVRIHWTWMQIYYYDNEGPHLLNPNSFADIVEAIAIHIHQNGIFPEKSHADPEIRLFLGRRNFI